jgi:hypothetical protein
MNTQRIYFPVNHHHVIVAEFNDGSFCATLEDVAEGWVAGRGPTLLSAIADLTERNSGLED